VLFENSSQLASEPTYHLTSSSGKQTDDRREVIGGGESAPTEDGDGDGEAGDMKRSVVCIRHTNGESARQ
jgi:hypothetical protein